ncbi:putative bifunctional diguanylate cyclase/phosphodiesterase [Roseobacter sp. CCS2]|uniref:putative bifunctional diguanylate cyclase/phosphodiesterase n=1 Tax=Roseobacter sp. CCS2 TaxID=391593 RepID=UPI0000F4049E|nr:bifunctional diguanylate cyclase/phosphodiesterase [Roseobacter sp. CCS2]EBA14212.1 GGDEF/EAL domain protein [Roseobacter sp. CCS2]
MLATQNQAENATASLFLRKPDRLWLHYCSALVIVLCLIVATYLLNRTMLEKGLIAADGITSSNEHVLLAQDIVGFSNDLLLVGSTDFAALEKAINRFEAVYSDILTTQVRSDLVNDHFFGQNAQVHQRIRAFANIAKQLSDAPPDVQLTLNIRLRRIYENGLIADLRVTPDLVAKQLAIEAAHFTTLQRAMLAASAIVLLAEALFIFLPAQRSVQSNLRAMRQTTNDLRNSQTQLKKMNTQLEHTVRHDQLTGLPNRRSLIEYIGNTVSNKDADERSLLLVGLDDFKSVNDTMGHDYGDALLIAVSQALKNCVDYDNLVAHVGGDEFALISREPTPYLIERITASLQEPFHIKGRRIPINASIGHLQMGDLERTPLDILADAEIALQYAKNSGGNRAQAFTQHLRDDLGMMQQLQLDLMDAIRNGEIEPWFQPQVRLADGQLHGAEVLARWRHPTRGLLTPDKFMPAAERAGLMIDLDHAIWRAAMDLAKNWEASDVWQPVISLNAAPDTISDPHLLERFLLALQRSGLNADQVIVEVLETTLIDGKDDIAAINIDSLADCGIALELDDFGTGYASLSKLTQLPLAGIKLDRSLVAPLPDQAADSIIRAILALAAELGLHVVAEGVEEDEQAVHLNARGCGVGQGYGFGRPMPPDAFTRWLEQHAKTPPQVGPDMARFA